MFLMQNAVHAGRLIVAQPGITLADPVVAIVWGVVVFRESVQTGPLLAGALCSAALLAGGAVVLARSPLLEDEGADTEDASTRPGADEDPRRSARAS
jgi:drug/metabolite transporter (DMT)-like permease